MEGGREGETEREMERERGKERHKQALCLVSSYIPDKKKKLKKFIATKPVLQEMLKGLLQEEEEKKVQNMNNKMTTTEKIAITTYPSMITFNVNG